MSALKGAIVGMAVIGPVTKAVQKTAVEFGQAIGIIKKRRRRRRRR
jgi:hypothetical protein